MGVGIRLWKGSDIAGYHLEVDGVIKAMVFPTEKRNPDGTWDVHVLNPTIGNNRKWKKLKAVKTLEDAKTTAEKNLV
jgi:hypothetical protein